PEPDEIDGDGVAEEEEREAPVPERVEDVTSDGEDELPPRVALDQRPRQHHQEEDEEVEGGKEHSAERDSSLAPNPIRHPDRSGRAARRGREAEGSRASSQAIPRPRRAARAPRLRSG